MRNSSFSVNHPQMAEIYVDITGLNENIFFSVGKLFASVYNRVQLCYKINKTVVSNTE